MSHHDAPSIEFKVNGNFQLMPNNMVQFFNSINVQLSSDPSYPNALNALKFYHDHIFSMVVAITGRHDQVVDKNEELNQRLKECLEANQALDEVELAKNVRALKSENRKILEDNLALREDIKRMKNEADQQNEEGPKVREIQTMVRQQMEQIQMAEHARTTFTAEVAKLANDCLKLLGGKPIELDSVKASLDYEQELNSTLYRNLRKVRTSIKNQTGRQIQTSTPNRSGF